MVAWRVNLSYGLPLQLSRSPQAWKPLRWYCSQQTAIVPAARDKVRVHENLFPQLRSSTTVVGPSLLAVAKGFVLLLLTGLLAIRM